MVCTYEEYLKQSKAITFEKMQIFHAEMLAEIGADTEALSCKMQPKNLSVICMPLGRLSNLRKSFLNQ